MSDTILAVKQVLFFFCFFCWGTSQKRALQKFPSSTAKVSPKTACHIIQCLQFANSNIAGLQPQGAHSTILCVNTCVKGVLNWGYHIIGIFEVYCQILGNIICIFLIYSLINPYLNFKHPILHLMFSKFHYSWIKHTLHFNAPCLLIFLSVPPVTATLAL